MKLLINLCAHDGIISHYTGVGTMVKRYIVALTNLLQSKSINYHLNLLTPEYSEDSFGYSKITHSTHEKLPNTTIIQVSNGSNGKINYGTPSNWQTLCQYSATIINNLDISKYDTVITIANDTPFANILSKINDNPKHKKVWIPHSTVKIHLVDSAIENSENLYDTRLKWEQEAINYININSNSYLGGIGNFIIKHLITEYNLQPNKVKRITNGEILSNQQLTFSPENEDLFQTIKDYDSIVLSFARAEEYKNLEATMLVGEALNLPTIVITQSYYKEQPILEKYGNLAKKTGTNLYIDPPFDFAKYILHNFNKPIVVIIPSKKEIMGLVINEMRKLNKDNLLIVANNIDGLNEQVTDGKDGLLVNLDNIEESKNKILLSFNKEKMKELNFNAQETLKEKYNFIKNCDQFLQEMLGDKYE